MMKRLVAEVVFKSGTEKNFYGESFDEAEANMGDITKVVSHLRNMIAKCYGEGTNGQITIGYCVIDIAATASINLYIGLALK